MTPTVPAYLENIRIVLSRTSHPANIGAARAMKTMGLVSPVFGSTQPHA